MKRYKYLLLAFLSIFFGTQTVFALSSEIAIQDSSVYLSSETILEGQTVRIYATVQNLSNKDLLGTVQFYDNSAGAQIGSDQTVSVFANKTDDIFVDWTPYFEGTHKITISLDPWITKDDDPNNNTVTISANILKDTDHDGITDDQDPDDDGDGVNDEEDHFPEDASEWVDTDGDRKGDNADEDDDNDGYIDSEDALPLNSLEHEDTDNDGIGNVEDNDDDNDELSDEDEAKLGTDPVNPDTDEDTVIDGLDAFPLDQNEQYDFDNDGLGDNTDTDDDNDGISDEEDSNDHNQGPEIIITGNKNLTFLNRETILSAKDSIDEDGEIKQVQWIIDEKDAKLGFELNYTFEKMGNHTIKVIAIDDKDESREITFTLSVINLDLYLSVFLILIIIFLAILILFKYSSLAFKK